MQFIQTKAKIQNGQLILEQPRQDIPTDTEVEIVIIVPEESRSIDFDRSRTEMQADFKKAGIETKEQILELIRDVKKELDRERQE